MVVSRSAETGPSGSAYISGITMQFLSDNCDCESSDMKVGIFLSHENASCPTRSYKNDVGYDLYAIEDIDIEPGQFAEIKTGVHLALPENLFAQINTRSSFGKKGMYVHHGVIDPGYTGEVTLFVMNICIKKQTVGLTKKETFSIEKGDRIAQLLFHWAVTPELQVITELPTTERGEKGHGSSGK